MFVKLFYEFPLLDWLAVFFYKLEMPRWLYLLRLAFFTTPDGDHLIYPPEAIGEIHGLKVYDQVFKPEDGFTVVDVGAHVGIYTLKASHMVGQTGLVVAVEPDPTNFNLLSFHVKINKLKNVILANRALLERSGEIKLYRGQFDSSHSSVNIQNKEKWEYVYATTFDDLMREVGVHSVNLVKIDVEGAETNVVRGMKTILPDKLVLAAYHTPREVQEIERLLTCMSYATKTILVNGQPYVYAWKHNKDKTA